MCKKAISLLILIFGLSEAKSQDCYTLAWSDEFDGNKLDMNKWSFQNGNGYPILTDWGNQELQYYTSRPQNVEVSNGSLKLTARRENIGGKQYTSGRIKSKGTFDFKYGRIEARIKIPTGSSLWPAFWLLPSENVFGAWPYSGEIDIMENYGNTNVIGSTIHYKDGANTNQWNAQSRTVTMDEYHTFAAVWDEDIISFYADWNWIGNERPSDLRGGRWPFNENFFLILNMAMNTQRAGSPSNTTFPKTMEVDYVRVYQKTNHIQIEGPKLVYPAQVVKFKLPKNSTATYNWTAPNGGSILAGQGTNEVTVKWGTTNGNILCNSGAWSGDNAGATQTCPNASHTKAVTVIPKSCDVPILNFDGVQKLIPVVEDGIGGIESMFEKNDFKNSINNSNHVGRFARVGNQPFDVLKLDFTEPIDPATLRSGLNKLLMDVYSTGSSIPITIELVNRSKNTGYPNGIHSQYTATTSAANTWNTLSFAYTNTPDWSINGEEVNGMNILFNPNTNTTSTYYFDNLRTQSPIDLIISGNSAITSTGASNLYTYNVVQDLGSTYDWTVGTNTVISSGKTTNDLKVYFNPGTYNNTITVSQTNSMACNYSLSKTVSVSGLTNVDSEQLSQNIQLFPNPLKNELNIASDLGKEMEFKIFNVQGELVKEGVILDQVNINTESLELGIYFLNLSNEGQNQTFKIVKN